MNARQAQKPPKAEGPTSNFLQEDQLCQADSVKRCAVGGLGSKGSTGATAIPGRTRQEAASEEASRRRCSQERWGQSPCGILVLAFQALKIGESTSLAAVQEELSKCRKEHVARFRYFGQVGVQCFIGRRRVSSKESLSTANAKDRQARNYAVSMSGALP